MDVQPTKLKQTEVIPVGILTLDEDSFVGHFAEMHAVALSVALKLKLVAAVIIERVIDLSSGQYILREVDGEM